MIACTLHLMQHSQASLEYPDWLQTQGVCKALGDVKDNQAGGTAGEGAREEQELQNLQCSQLCCSVSHWGLLSHRELPANCKLHRTSPHPHALFSLSEQLFSTTGTEKLGGFPKAPSNQRSGRHFL